MFDLLLSEQEPPAVIQSGPLVHTPTKLLTACSLAEERLSWKGPAKATRKRPSKYLLNLFFKSNFLFGSADLVNQVLLQHLLFIAGEFLRTMGDTLRPPSLQVSVPNDGPVYSDGGGPAVSDGCVPSSSSTPTLRRKRFKMRRMRNVASEKEGERERLAIAGRHSARCRSGSKEYLQLPSIEITPSSDEDGPSSWSRCSTPSASPRRKRFLLRKWLKVREKKEQSSESRSVPSLHLPLLWSLTSSANSPHVLSCCFKSLSSKIRVSFRICFTLRSEVQSERAFLNCCDPRQESRGFSGFNFSKHHISPV